MPGRATSRQIYNMLRDYKGHVTVKIDSLAASAASVIAMAGDEVLISPTGMFMIHNPSTVAMGDHGDLEKAIDMLNEVKNSIINAYQAKTGMSRAKLSKLMEDETWMDANKAVEFGFADDVIHRNDPAVRRRGSPMILIKRTSTMASFLLPIHLSWQLRISSSVMPRSMLRQKIHESRQRIATRD